MKVIRIVFGLLLAALLSACGGGGGSPGSPGGVDIALFTSAPATGATVPLNGAEVYAVGGGKAPYTVSSSNRFVALAGVSGNKITVGGVAEGTASVEVRDALGAAVTLRLRCLMVTIVPFTPLRRAPSRSRLAARLCRLKRVVVWRRMSWRRTTPV